MSPAFRRLSLLILLALLAAFAPYARPASAASIVVGNLNDSGAGSLREAITQANLNANADTITFSVAGKITLASPLPALTSGNITIDGTIPPQGTIPRVEISGGGSPAGVRGQGILIKSSNNVIRGLIINGFADLGLAEYRGAGIIISGEGLATPPAGNRIERNYIGTDATGNAAAPGGAFNNFNGGIIIQNGASNTTIQNNVISGNNGWGIYIDRSITTSALQQNTVIANNMIGVNAAGTQAVSNRAHGVVVGTSSANTTVGPGNVISGNGAGKADANYGVFVNGTTLFGGSLPTGTRVIGNKIGTDVSGTVAIPNTGQLAQGSGGVGIGEATGTTIGGPTAADGNLISGNEEYGITHTGAVSGPAVPSNTTIQNNKIGVKQDGLSPLANTQGGVLLSNRASGVTVGPGNIISGNSAYGVFVRGVRNETNPAEETRDNTITGNFIGTGPGGTGSIANTFYGVYMTGGTTGNTVAGNVIANSGTSGIRLSADTSTTPRSPTGNTFSSNQIRNNGVHGIHVLSGSNSNVIGPGNTITDHSNTGIQLEADGTVVKGNTIGPGNQVGINIANGASGNTIGGATEADGNHVSGNTSDGIRVTGSTSVGNRITRTTTETNGGKGIALTNGGNLADQPSRPGLTGLAVSGTTLSGALTNAASCGGNGCRIEIFTSQTDPVDEGPIFLTAFTSAGSFSNVSVAGCQPFLIFTVTDSAGNTSEFMSKLGPLAQCVPAAPQVDITPATPGPSVRNVLPGATTIYTHTVSNVGTGPGPLSLSISQAPAGNAWATLNRGTCPAEGGQLAAGASCTIQVRVTVPANAAPGAQNVTTVTASIGSSTDSATDTTTALLNPALEFTPTTQTKTAGPGQPVSFQHTLTNRGNGTDSFTITVTPPSPQWSYSVAPAGQITLAKDASATVTVTLTSPANVAPSPPSYSATVRAASVAAPSVFKTVTDIVNITGAAVPQIASTVVPPSVDQGGSTTVTYTITNTGNQSGTFELDFTPPPGWAVTGTVSDEIELDVGASATFSVMLQAPANAIAGSYPVRLTATATDANGATATKIDQIVVNKRAALDLSPESQTTPDRAPNAIYTDTLTLTNNGNFTDTIALEASSSQGWSVRPIPASVTLNPSASRAISVELTIPPGVPATTLPNTTTVTATSSLQTPAVVSDTAEIITAIDAIPGVSLEPPLIERAVEAGLPVTFTFTLRNSGSVAQSYSLAATDVPLGWDSSLTPQETPTLAPGATVPVQLVLTPPDDTPEGTVTDVTIEATAQDTEPFPTDEATARLRIGPPFGVELGGACVREARPGDLVRCTHTITNSGTLADTFAIVASSPLGWDTLVAPPSLLLAPGTSATFTVTLQVPTSADAGVVHLLTVSARPTSATGVSAQVIDITTVLQVAGVSFSPSQVSPLLPNEEVTFQHALINTGNAMDSFTITATQELDWPITIVPTQTIKLPRGVSYPVAVSVQIPANAPAPVNRITVRATSRFDPRVYTELTDVISAQSLAPDVTIYLPVLAR